MYEDLKKELYKAHMNLEKYGLVAYTSGNVSVKVNNHVIIKPSGIPYDELKTEDMVVLDMEGNVVEGKLKPSVDSATHLYLYKNLPDVGSIIHTHSPYASAFALLSQPIPVYSTAHADVFGVQVPVSNYAPVGSEAIGKAVIEVVNQAKAVLLSKHGVIVMGKDIKEAIRKAIFLEEIAQTAYFARTIGNLEPLDEKEAKRLYEFHHSNYGQK
ncbi:ribulose 5-phosphate epimerase [Petrotoga sp. HKA.pet.4.5]|uniref:L-ribulose-5-phosphate 4-epimerase n=1 Tax=unclassified Petrotoga TaxID=2620614 RepID=UPI000CB4E34B|nr:MULTISPECIES: L-ribulose-5-phosphate 4-epimerase [unclassified Petrotoga]PNR89489.1 L-ribulose-5-phosphate 4-epimerase [Petrotoga sp. 9T1HF07.CasAA.8.2]RLL83956.1 ribulose 5-phosphate epimerase [Petrotoga sp. Shatin.DS.tank11.9.2.9.3]RLL90420.1 ribulose 5-phosphate epimerase [Petrotoga sp. HKA.pet.4.5]